MQPRLLPTDGTTDHGRPGAVRRPSSAADTVRCVENSWRRSFRAYPTNMALVGAVWSEMRARSSAPRMAVCQPLACRKTGTSRGTTR